MIRGGEGGEEEGAFELFVVSSGGVFAADAAAGVASGWCLGSVW